VAKTDFRSHDEYLAVQPPKVRTVLRKVRAAIRKGAPDAEEVISYQVPAFRQDGVPVLYYAGFTEHWSLSCPPPLPLQEFPALARYPSSKSAIRFPLDEAVPAALVTAVAKHRVKVAKAMAAAKRAHTKR
jgi:uncharacterized protein YdhG (YjbR/CyaY superfamily)